MKLNQIVLEPRQSQVQAIRTTGNYVVLGTAGSGKTTIALARAQLLSNLSGRPKILIATYNKSLVEYMKIYSGILSSNVEILTYHQVANRYLRKIGKISRTSCILLDDEKKNLIEKAKLLCRTEEPDESTFRRPTEDFVDEIKFIQSFGLYDLDDYQNANRIGRKDTRILNEKRKCFHKVFVKYLEEKQLLITDETDYVYDWDDIAYYMNKYIEENGDTLYDHIIIDEGQDFTPMMIKSLTKAVKQDGSFMFFGDVAQQIYGKSNMSWKESGINLGNNRIWRFDTNYRNTPEIIKFAEDIKSSKYWENDSDMVDPKPVRVEGAKPALIKFNTVEEEDKGILDVLRENMDRYTNVVLFRTDRQINRFKGVLEKNNIMYTKLKDATEDADITKPGVYLSTYHSVKGLEFENVFMPSFNDDVIPNPTALEIATDEDEILLNEIKLFYVAVTRSRFGVYISYTDILSSLFPIESNNYTKAEA